MDKKRFRIFVSSPSDVFAERERLDRVIARLNGEFGGDLLEAIRWERSYYSAAKTFQDQIPLPSQTDLVVCIFWKRLGFELPADYRRPDGTTPTGTEYEFEDAIAAARAKGTPDVLVYRKVAPVLLSAEQVQMETAQLEALKHFWTRWFQTEAGQFTAAYQTFDNTDGFERQVEEHIRQWLGRHSVASAGITWPIAEMGSPFRGLLAFEARHAAVFFGRRRTVERGRERIVDAATRGAPFLLVLGTSGSGKSSLARAGLLPRITQPGAVANVDLWRTCTLRPSEADTPLDALARALYAPGALPELAASDCPNPADLAQLHANAPDAAARAIRLALVRATAETAKREGFDRAVEARLLLLVDQCEEALRDPAARDQFGRALQSLVASGIVWVVATMRSDLYALFQVSPPLMALRDAGAQLDLTPPGQAELTEIITGPAAAAGLTYETRPNGVRLDEELAHAAGPAELPLLQLALQALFEARDPNTNTLTCAAYDAIGGLGGVVERRAEATLAGLDPPAQAALAPVLRAMVDVTEDGAVTSRATQADPLLADPATARLVDTFVAARLLVLDSRDSERLLRVAHESLLTGWPRAAALLADDREMLRTRGRVQSAARRWRAEARNADFLLPPGRPLAEALELVAARPETLDPDGLAFVADSRTADDARTAAVAAQANRELRLAADAQQARADAASRVVRRTRIAVAVVSVLLVAAAAAAIFATQQRSQAIAQSAEARRQEQAANQQRTRAEANFSAALDGSAKLMDVVSAHLKDGGMTRTVSRALLDDAGASLGQLGADGGAPPLLDTKARMLASLAAVQRATCDGDGAIARATEAVALAETALAQSPTTERKIALAQRLDVLAQALGENERYADADPIFLKAAALVGDPAPEPGSPSDAAWQAVRRSFAFSLLARQDYAPAIPRLERDIAWLDQRLAATPGDTALLDLQANDRRNLAFGLTRLDREADAAPVLDAERATLEKLIAGNPDNLAWQRALSINTSAHARLAANRGDKDQAIQLARDAEASARSIAQHDRSNGDWQQDEVLAATGLSRTIRRFQGAAGSLEPLRNAMLAVEALDRAGANSVRCRYIAANMRTTLGLSLNYVGSAPEAAKQLARSAALFADLARNQPEKRIQAETAQLWAARAYRTVGDLPNARRFDDAAVASARALAAERPADPELAATLADARDDLAETLLKLDDLDAAAREYEAIAADAARMAANDPKNPAWQHLQVATLVHLAGAYNAKARNAEQWDALQRAILAARREVAIAPDALEPNLDLVDSLATSVIPQVVVGRKDAALETARESVALAEKLQSAHPTDVTANQRLGMALLSFSFILKWSDQPDEATAAMTRSQAALKTAQNLLNGPTN